MILKSRTVCTNRGTSDRFLEAAITWKPFPFVPYAAEHSLLRFDTLFGIGLNRITLLLMLFFLIFVAYHSSVPDDSYSWLIDPNSLLEFVICKLIRISHTPGVGLADTFKKETSSAQLGLLSDTVCIANHEACWCRDGLSYRLQFIHGIASPLITCCAMKLAGITSILQFYLLSYAISFEMVFVLVGKNPLRRWVKSKWNWFFEQSRTKSLLCNAFEIKILDAARRQSIWTDAMVHPSWRKFVICPVYCQFRQIELTTFFPLYLPRNLPLTQHLPIQR